MSAKHTPGPWVVNEAGSAIGGMPFKITELYVYAPSIQDDTAICADVIDPVTQEPSMANARLIAAAPELLEALKTAQWMLERDYIDPQKLQVIEKCEAAIAKATGQDAQA